MNSNKSDKPGPALRVLFRIARKLANENGLYEVGGMILAKRRNPDLYGLVCDEERGTKRRRRAAMNAA